MPCMHGRIRFLLAGGAEEPRSWLFFHISVSVSFTAYWPNHSFMSPSPLFSLFISPHLSSHSIQRHLASINEQIWSDSVTSACVCVMCVMCAGELLYSADSLHRNLSRISYENMKTLLWSVR